MYCSAKVESYNSPYTSHFVLAFTFSLISYRLIYNSLVSVLCLHFNISPSYFSILSCPFDHWPHHLALFISCSSSPFFLFSFSLPLPPLSLSCSRFAVLSLQRLTFLFLYNFLHYLFDFLSLILSPSTIVYQTISSECFSPSFSPSINRSLLFVFFLPLSPFFHSFLPSPISFSSTCIFAFGFSSSRECVILIVFSWIAY